MEPYRIVLAEDHILFRELIKKNLGEIPDMEVVGEVGDGLELLEAIKTLKPHMVIVDIGMPILSGIEAARTIKQTYPEIKILLLTMYKSKSHIKRALDAGVDGYLLKENAFKDLITAIDMVRKGTKYISSFVIDKMVNIAFSDDRKESIVNVKLSNREIEVLKYFAEGKSPKEIANMLSISYMTVRTHISNIKMKLSIDKGIDLVKYALKKGYTSISS